MTDHDAELVSSDGHALAGFGHLSDVLALADVVVDLVCTKCARRVEGVDVLTAVHSRPCQLCAGCAECRSLCLAGATAHGVDPAFFTELKAVLPAPKSKPALES